MSPIRRYTSLALLLAAAGWGCRPSEEQQQAAEARMSALAFAQGQYEMVSLQQRLAYTLDLYRRETNGLPANASELNAFLAARFQPVWLDGSELDELSIAAPPGDPSALQIAFAMQRAGEMVRSTFPYPRQAPDYYAVVYNDIPMTDRAAATLLSHYTRRPVTLAILFDEYFIAEYEGAKDVLPPRLSLDGVRFVPIYPPPEPGSDVDDTAATPGASEQQAQDQMSDGAGETASPHVNSE